MKLLAVQLGARMAGDLVYATDQTSTLILAATNRVFRFGINEAWFKTLQDVVVNLREEIRDSEAERRILSGKNCIVACMKATLEDHGQNCIMACKKATLEDHVAILEDQA
ncbi:unnamed protein product [Lactuca saligna]|uniref:Uncharacterized protein n=1 Tax=Lactuca saligna TaxID=75948 RepID=A0AA35ZE19_LACSI|nr:unnamed protein product [Lactuca saligna]